MKSRLFCTFTTKQALDETIQHIKLEYKVFYNKVFVLESDESEEYFCTYNIESVGGGTEVIPNTIMVHRKKETNTLYTINSLNLLIKSLNDGVLDVNYRVDWTNYRNTLLLTQGADLKKLGTRVHKIVTV